MGTSGISLLIPALASRIIRSSSQDGVQHAYWYILCLIDGCKGGATRTASLLDDLLFGIVSHRRQINHRVLFESNEREIVALDERNCLGAERPAGVGAVPCQ
jgi:hypothetical protein